MIKFILSWLLTSALLISFVFIAHQQSWISARPSFLFPTLIMVSATTLAIYSYLYKKISTQKESGIIFPYLFTVVVRLFLFATYALVMIFRDSEGAFLNVGFFMIAYILFTALEIGFLYREISERDPSEKP